MGRPRNAPHECVAALVKVGMTEEHATALRRHALILHRWYELECGTGDGGIERDEKTGAVTFYHSRTQTRTPYPDRETPARAAIAKIMESYPDLMVYHQTDPRGAPLYVLRPGDIPEGEKAESYYNRGIAVHR